MIGQPCRRDAVGKAVTLKIRFTLGLDILETLVLAATRGKSELTFDEFVDDWLYGQCRLVVGRNAAAIYRGLSLGDAVDFGGQTWQVSVGTARLAHRAPPRCWQPTKPPSAIVPQ